MKILREGYSFKKTLGKIVVGFVLFAVPVLLDALPEEWMNLTLGSMLVGAWNFIKYNYLTRA